MVRRDDAGIRLREPEGPSVGLHQGVHRDALVDLRVLRSEEYSHLHIRTYQRHPSGVRAGGGDAHLRRETQFDAVGRCADIAVEHLSAGKVFQEAGGDRFRPQQGYLVRDSRYCHRGCQRIV